MTRLALSFCCCLAIAGCSDPVDMEPAPDAGTEVDPPPPPPPPTMGDASTPEEDGGVDAPDASRPPDPRDVPLGPVGEVSFVDTTARYLDPTPADVDDGWGTNNAWEFEFTDFDGDGRLDLALPDHVGTTRIWVQRPDGTFRFLDANATGLHRVSGHQRATSNFFFIDVDADGLPDMSGHDPDGGPSILLLAQHGVGDETPRYAPAPLRGCRYGRDNCVFGALMNDNRMVTISASRPVAPDNVQREIRDILTDEVVLPADNVSGDAEGSAAATYLIVDLDNDTCPDIVNLFADGFWQKDRTSSGCADTFTWRAGRFDDPANHSDPGCGGACGPFWQTRHAATADFDNDGFADVYYRVGPRNDEDTLGFARMCLNDGTAHFVCHDVPTAGGPPHWINYANTHVGDIDNDGDIDIVSAGEARSDTITIYLNDGTGRFAIIENPVDFEGAHGKARVSLADFNDDGLLDLAKTGRSREIDGLSYVGVGLFQNNTNNDFHYLKLKVRGEGNNTDGLHARIRVYEAGTRRLIAQRQVQNLPYANYATEVHFGLGAHDRVDVEVIYPNDGPRYTLEGVAADQTILAYPTRHTLGYRAGDPFPL
ncbi:MAG: CRTAC1 family protein [Myxococcota bacterium]|nr:CRTAC1 family protein [Myxococcota bacterium]